MTRLISDPRALIDPDDVPSAGPARFVLPRHNESRCYPRPDRNAAPRAAPMSGVVLVQNDLDGHCLEERLHATLRHKVFQERAVLELVEVLGRNAIPAFSILAFSSAKCAL